MASESDLKDSKVPLTKVVEEVANVFSQQEFDKGVIDDLIRMQDARYKALWKLCQDWIQYNHVDSQLGIVQAQATPLWLATEICKIVGWYIPPPPPELTWQEKVAQAIVALQDNRESVASVSAEEILDIIEEHCPHKDDE